MMKDKFLQIILLLVVVGAFCCGCAAQNTAITEVDYQAPEDQLSTTRGELTQDRYSNHWMGVSFDIPENLQVIAPAVLEEYNLSLRKADSDRYYEMYACPANEQTSLEILITVETGGMALCEGIEEDYETFLNDIGDGSTTKVKWKTPETCSFLNETYNLYRCDLEIYQDSGDLAMEHTTWFLFREKENRLITLRFSAVKGELELAEILSLLGNEETPVAPEIPKATEEEQPQNVDVQKSDPNLLSQVLDFSKSWKYSSMYEGNRYAVHFAFEHDGTAYMTIGDDGGSAFSGGHGSYKIVGDGILFEILLDGKNMLVFTYAFDAQNLCFIQQSDEGVFHSHQRGDVFYLQENPDTSAEKIKGMAEHFAGPVQKNTSSFESYLQKVENPDQPIYSGPGYHYDYVDTVRQAGTFTIVEEARDIDGNLWGKLKSGLGWIDLSDVRGENSSDYDAALPVTVDWASEDGDYVRECVVDDSEYAVWISLTAHEEVTEVLFYTLTPDYDGGYSLGEVRYGVPGLMQAEAVAVLVSFPGDMSFFGISYVDASGRTRYCAIGISGYDGSLTMDEFWP